MKQEIEIYLHVPGRTEEKIVRVPSISTVHDLMEAARRAGLAIGPETRISIEDEEEPLKGDTPLSDRGVKHKHHLHCHTCDKITVLIHFNGVPKEHRFAPGKKVKKVLNWAVEAFGLSGVDAENKELRQGTDEGNILQSLHHIGSYVKPGHCSLDLYLTPIVEVQG